MHDNSPALHDPTCRNCAATLTGPYCAQCGQHAHESARSLHVLLHEGWHLLTHLDGRLWRTLQTLLFRPGQLTFEYFADRRARYVPPFQLYFVISVALFAVAALTDTFSVVPTPAQAAPFTAADRDDLNQLGHAGAPAPVADSVAALTAQHGVTPQLAAQLCSHVGIGAAWADLRLQAVCRHQLADRGRSMIHEFGSLVPKMMFALLPLMALVMLALYRSPPRLYVEHLVFFLHLQSDLFLLIILQLLLLQLAALVPVFGAVTSISGPVVLGYSAWYGYAALRRYYGQSGGDTFAKLAAVAVAYLVCFVLALFVTMLVSALVT